VTRVFARSATLVLLAVGVLPVVAESGRAVGARARGEAEIREAYPRLTSAMIRLAPLYATAYPLRGRPRKTVMLDIAPSRSIRRPLSPPK
jgi:hypothetical protein